MTAATGPFDPSERNETRGRDKHALCHHDDGEALLRQSTRRHDAHCIHFLPGDRRRPVENPGLLHSLSSRNEWKDRFQNAWRPRAARRPDLVRMTHTTRVPFMFHWSPHCMNAFRMQDMRGGGQQLLTIFNEGAFETVAIYYSPLHPTSGQRHTTRRPKGPKAARASPRQDQDPPISMPSP